MKGARVSGRPSPSQLPLGDATRKFGRPSGAGETGSAATSQETVNRLFLAGRERICNGRRAMRSRSAILALMGCLIQSPLGAEDATRILFIGNSYTGQVRGAVTELIKASPEGASTRMEFITPGGKTLESHLQTSSTVERIRNGRWDFVVLQDQSQTPAVFPEKFEGAAIGLDKVIDASGARTVFYQTWGRRDGDKMNPRLFPDYQSMQETLSGNYRRTAERCDAILAPVGDAWARVRKEDPELGAALYKGDGSHPSGKGAYLVACVLYATIFERSPADLRYESGLSERDTKVILAAVGEAVGNSLSGTYPVTRTLTNTSGKRIKAQITGRSRSRVYFTSGGKGHTYDISQLSEADKGFVDRLSINRRERD